MFHQLLISPLVSFQRMMMIITMFIPRRFYTYMNKHTKIHTLICIDNTYIKIKNIKYKYKYKIKIKYKYKKYLFEKINLYVSKDIRIKQYVKISKYVHFSATFTFVVQVNTALSVVEDYKFVTFYRVSAIKEMMVIMEFLKICKRTDFLNQGRYVLHHSLTYLWVIKYF